MPLKPKPLQGGLKILFNFDLPQKVKFLLDNFRFDKITIE